MAPTLFLFIYYILIEVKDILPIKQFLKLALSIVPILLMVHFGPHATRVSSMWGFLDGWAVLQLGYGVGVWRISKELLDSRVRSWQLRMQFCWSISRSGREGRVLDPNLGMKSRSHLYKGQYMTVVFGVLHFWYKGIVSGKSCNTRACA